MKKLRWAMDGGFWEVDLSTPVTVDGVARPIPVPGEPLPLGLTRGLHLSRPKQIDFFQRFMAVPVVPSFSDANGLSFQRLLSLPLPFDNSFTTLLGEFNVRKFASSIRRNGFKQDSESSFWQNIWRHLSNPKLYALNFCSEWLLTPEDSALLSLEAQGDDEIPLKKKAVLHHKFPNHNLTLEASSPSLFVDHLGNYWDVPFTLDIDVASVSSDSGTSCRFCINRSTGSPKQCEGQLTTPVPPSLLPGLCAKCAISVKKNFYLWRSEAPKTRMVQPYDMLHSNPHISASAILGSVITASLGDKTVRGIAEDDSFGLHAKGTNSIISADLFTSASLSAQHGNFQKRFLDLTRFYARLDIPSVSKFLNGASRVAFAFYNSQEPSMEAVQTITPSASLSFQQQIAGPFSFRIDAGLRLDLKKEWYLDLNDPVFAVEYALHVLGSAKAVAWYSPKQREFMIELRFFET
ncbi:hypothetical protein ACS0TY_023696 [Phlomoides rotata]